FVRLLQQVEEAMTARKMGEVTELAQHYFAVLELIPNGARAHELKRVPQLLSLLKGVETLGLMHTLAEPLTREILSATRLHWPCHRESANCLAWVAQNAGHFEDFEFVRKVAVDLKCAMALYPGQHGDCCGRVLAERLAPEALDRLIESHLQRRGAPRWAKPVTSLLAMIGAPGAEAIFRRLDEE